MIPKTKAVLLYDKYYLLCTEINPMASIEARNIYAKRMAINAVDELIDFMDGFDLDLNLKHRWEWWKQVRKELESI